MRHLFANIFVYTLAGLLLLGSALFAWIRSEQVIVTREPIAVARFAEEAPSPDQLFALGEAAYVANCQHCHGAEGRGWDQYPRVTDMHRLVAAPGGRDYYIALHLFGLSSPRWRAPMPPMGHLPDVELAAVLDYVAARYGQPLPSPITPGEIAAWRAAPLSPRDVGRLRPEL